MKKLGEKEYQNIFKLEMDEMLAEKPFFKFFLKIPPFNPSQVFLGFSRKTPATPFHSG
jgi:hypothetical protein